MDCTRWERRPLARPRGRGLQDGAGQAIR